MSAASGDLKESSSALVQSLTVKSPEPAWWSGGLMEDNGRGSWIRQDW